MSEDRSSSSGAPPPGNDNEDLRSTIAAALAEDAQAAQTPPPQPSAQSPATPPQTPETPPAGEPPSQETPASPPSGPAPTPEEQETGGEPPKAAERPDEPPKNWSQQDRDMFGALPEEARAPFMQLYKRMEGGFTRNLQRGAALEKDYGEIDKVIFSKEARDRIAAQNLTIPQIIGAWANVENALTGPNAELKAQTIARIIHGYKADTTRIAAIINELRGFAPAGGSDGRSNGAPPPTPPANGPGGGTSLEERLSAMENATAARYRLEANQAIESFANERDANGNLAHPHYADLEGEIANLANAERAAGKILSAADLPRLYERALWSDPSTREKQLQAEREAATQQAADEARQRADRARRAASSVTGAPGGPGQSRIPDEELSIRDNIVKNMTQSPASRGGRGRI